MPPVFRDFLQENQFDDNADNPQQDDADDEEYAEDEDPEYQVRHAADEEHEQEGGLVFVNGESYVVKGSILGTVRGNHDDTSIVNIS